MKPRWRISWDRMQELGKLWCELWGVDNAGANTSGQWFHSPLPNTDRITTGLQPWPDVIKDLMACCEQVTE